MTKNHSHIKTWAHDGHYIKWWTCNDITLYSSFQVVGFACYFLLGMLFFVTKGSFIIFSIFTSVQGVLFLLSPFPYPKVYYIIVDALYIVDEITFNSLNTCIIVVFYTLKVKYSAAFLSAETYWSLLSATRSFHSTWAHFTALARFIVWFVRT